MSDGAARKDPGGVIHTVRGVRDILPPETGIWNWVEGTARSVFSAYGFGEIRPPIIEQSELFSRAVGSDTDIVTKEMYGFPKKLEILRRGTTDQVGRLENQANILNFGQTLAVLVLNLEQSLQGGEIPNIPQNLQAITNLKTISGQTIQLWNSGQRNPSAEWIRHFQEARQIINSLRLERLEESQSLRPEATASVCRAYIEHNMNQLPQPVKLYYMGPMFRRERPQKGRYRQFYQIGAEILGGPDAPAIDAEVIEMVMTFFAKLELQGVQLDINSIGCKNCRPKYVELLRAELQKVKDKLGADSQRRIETNPLRVLDSKLEHEQPIIEKLPRIADHLCDDCKTHYAEVKRQLDLRGVPYRENWRLVRGLDYYMRTTFEITATGLGSQNAVCGGGRYDGLVELLGGPPTKGIGFAIGEDRLVLSLQESSRTANISAAITGQASVTGTLRDLQRPDIYIAWMGERAQAAAIQAARTLRSAGFSVELPPVEQKFGKALGQADKLGAKFALILGDNEVTSGEWTLKTLDDGSQQKLTEPQLLEFLRKQKAESP